jgi:glycosyltransferase involved in cell wall biosynthesis
LARRGIDLELIAIPSTLPGRLHLWWRLHGADVIIVQRRLLAIPHVILLRGSGRRLVFDFDDAVFQRDSYSKSAVSPQRMRRFAAVVKAADHVVAGNDYLAAKAGRFVRRDRVHVFPTCVDASRYSLARHERRGQGVQLVWIGSSSTLQGMETRASLFDAVAEQDKGIRFKVICDRFPRFVTMPVLATRWSEESEARELADADIGVSWVPDDAWSLGKCGLKVLQYLAAGLPVVANPVGIQAHLVRHGETGFLCSTAEQWIESIQTLANDPELRLRMGQAGRQFVERHYSVAIGAERWLNLLKPLLATRAA